MSRRAARRARWLAPAACALAAACVDVPDRAPTPDEGALAVDARPMLDGAAPDSARPDTDAARPDLAVDAAPMPDAHPSGVTCPRPCPHPSQMAAYLAASRADAVEVLDDGSVLVAIGLDPGDRLLEALDARGLAPDEQPLTVPADLPPPTRPDAAPMQTRPAVLHLEPDLATLRRILLPEGPPIGPIVDIWRAPQGAAERPFYLVARHGAGLIRVGEPTAGAGYVVIGPYSPDGDADAPRATVIDAAQSYQLHPPGAADARGFVAVDGAPDAPGRSDARWFDEGGHPRALRQLRHHVAGEPPRDTFGPAPADVVASTLPLRVGDRCALWTSADEPGGPAVYLGPVPDGNGGQRYGRRPLDGFADAPCPVPDPAPGTLHDPAPIGAHGWSAIPGRSVAVGGVATTADGATVLGFDFGAAPGQPLGPAQVRVPAVAAYAPDGAVRWFQRLRADRLDGQAVINDSPQVVRGVAYDPGADGPPAVVVMAEGLTADPYPLWDAPVDGEPGFQGSTGRIGGSAAGWIGRLDAADGRLLATTWIYRLNVLPAPERMREGRLACFIDEARSAEGTPQRVQLDPGRVAVGPRGEVAIVGTGIGLSNTPDALQQTDAPYATSTSARFVRIYSADLSELLYATAVGPLPGDADGHVGLDVEVADLAFTAEGHLLVVGRQWPRDEDGDGVDDGARLPTVGVPDWADGAWPADVRSAESSRAFVLRLVPDHDCGG